MQATPDPPTRYVTLAGVLVVLLLGLGSVSMAHGVVEVQVSGASVTYQPVTAWFDWMGVAITGVAPLVALRFPWLAFVAAAAIPGTTAALSHGWPFTAFAGLIAVAVVAMWQRPLDSWWMGGLSLLLPLSLVWLGSVTAPDGMVVDLQLGYAHVWGRMLVVVVYAVATALVLGAGQGFRLAARRTQDEAAIAADRRSVGNEAATLGERSRLARDLHDVVAHHVSLIAVRAETAPYTMPDLSAGARLVLADIAEDSRKGRDELRGVLGILRRADGDSQRAPQPGPPTSRGSSRRLPPRARCRCPVPRDSARCPRPPGTSPTASSRRPSPTPAGMRPGLRSGSRCQRRVTGSGSGSATARTEWMRSCRAGA